MTRFYVATALERAKRAALLARVLAIEYGWVPSYAWWNHGSVQDDGPVRIQEVAERELQGVREADVVIVLLPGGRGTHIELADDCAGCIWSDAPPEPREVEEHPRVELLRGLLEDGVQALPWALLSLGASGWIALDLGGVL